MQNISKELDVFALTQQKNVALQEANDALQQQLAEYSKQFQSITAAVTRSNQVCMYVCVCVVCLCLVHSMCVHFYEQVLVCKQMH